MIKTITVRRTFRLLIFLISSCLYKVTSLESEGIIGGNEASPGMFTYHVSIEIFGMYVCGGSIIDSEFVITAAHCVTDSNGTLNSFPLTVVGGRVDLRSERLSTIAVQVKKVYIPKIFTGKKNSFMLGDIAILKLQTLLDVDSPNAYLRKLHLPIDGEPYTGTMVNVTGFGWHEVSIDEISKTHEIKEYGGSFEILRYAEAEVLDLDKCMKDGVLFVSDSQICAKIIQSDARHPAGICNGDSGGPLVYDGKTLIGIASISPIGCNESMIAAVYTKVSSYFDFIYTAVRDIETPDIISTTLPTDY